MKRLVQLADDNLNAAFNASALAPPSTGYVDRLRAIADAFEHLASTLSHAGRTTATSWAARDDWGPGTLPYEVRPGGNRPSRDGLWDGFDQASARLGEAMHGTDILAVAQAFRTASEELLAVADRLADTGVQQAEPTVG